ncbi:redoxin domain-containing protein [Salinigranum salinum]|uniref:redoxin domain-containing protein n=1 Tax=Salinigranum salinum TaxID=1364937 RepID=UPI001260C0A2|nr:redoxin domain-containing protein [Salinigranum salinum]
MSLEGNSAPTFTATLGSDEPEPFDLSDHLGSGPVVLAFFPGAFTPVCTNEMVTFEEHADEIEAAGATLFGVSADSPFTLGAFAEEYDLGFDLVSDMGEAAIGAYGVGLDAPGLGLYGIANRAVFVLDDEGAVVYEWVADDPTNEPDYEAVLDAIRAA